MEENFKIGDVVWLKSDNNVAMTVKSITHKEKSIKVDCVFFGCVELICVSFNQDMLTIKRPSIL